MADVSSEAPDRVLDTDCPVCLESSQFCPGCAGRLLVEVTFESPIAMTLPAVQIGGDR